MLITASAEIFQPLIVHREALDHVQVVVRYSNFYFRVAAFRLIYDISP